MKISYQATIDEAVEAQMRMLDLSNTVRKLKWQGLLVAPLVAVFAFFILSGDVTYKLILAGIITGLFVLFYLRSYDRIIRKRTRKLLIEGLGTDQPTACEYEASDKGLTFRRQGTDITFAWDTVTEINETKDYVEFVMGKNGIALMPNRIFADRENRQQWLAYALEHSAQAVHAARTHTH